MDCGAAPGAAALAAVETFARESCRETAHVRDFPRRDGSAAYAVYRLR